MVWFGRDSPFSASTLVPAAGSSIFRLPLPEPCPWEGLLSSGAVPWLLGSVPWLLGPVPTELPAAAAAAAAAAAVVL